MSGYIDFQEFIESDYKGPDSFLDICKYRQLPTDSPKKYTTNPENHTTHSYKVRILWLEHIHKSAHLYSTIFRTTEN